MNNRRNIAFIIIVLLTIIIPIFLNNFAANVEKFTIRGLITNAANIKKTNTVNSILPGDAVLLFPTATIHLNDNSSNIITTGTDTALSNKMPNIKSSGAEAFTLSNSRMDYLNTSQSQYQQPQPLLSQSNTSKSQKQQNSGGSLGAMYDQAVNFFSP